VHDSQKEAPQELSAAINTLGHTRKLKKFLFKKIGENIRAEYFNVSHDAGGALYLDSFCLAVPPFDFALTQIHKKLWAQENIYWLCRVTELEPETL